MNGRLNLLMKYPVIGFFSLLTVVVSGFSIYHVSNRTKVTSSTVPPILQVLTVYPGVTTIDVLLSLDQEGLVDCMAVDVNASVPIASEFRNMVKANGNNSYVTVSNLQSNHDYAVYCYAENEYELPPEAAISSTKQVVHTYPIDDSPILIVSSIIPQRDRATVDILSTVAGVAYCMIEEGSSHSINRLKVKNEGVSKPIQSYNFLAFTFTGLSPSTTYSLYCTSESNSGVPMRSDVERVSREFTTTEAELSAMVIIICIVVILLCILLSGLFSGMNLGLMGLDLLSLQMIADTNIEEIVGDTIDQRELDDLKKDKEAAQKIFPIRKKGNLLSCTLLVGNVIFNAIICIMLSSLTNEYLGLLIAICLIIAFGEVIPKAYGTLHTLQYGAMSAGLIKFFIGLFYILCKPISVLLDRYLGTELGNVYNRYQVYTALEMNKDRKAAKASQQDASSDPDSILHYMQPLDNVYMLPDTTQLNFATCLDIFRRGHSHIPIFHDDRQSIVGVLHVKELIMVDPKECLSVQSVMKLFPSNILVVSATQTIDEAIRDMMNAHTKLAFISRTIEHIDKDNTMEIAGIITLEDCLKAVLHLQSFDDPLIIDMRNANADLMSVINNIALSSLDPNTMHIIGTFINLALENQGYRLSDDVIRNLVREGTIQKVTVSDPPIYEVGKPCNFATIILKGVFTMIVGEDRMVAEKPVFSVINMSSILEENFVSSISLELHERPIVDMLTNEVTGFNSEGYVLTLTRESANKLNLKSRLIPLHTNSMNNVGGSEFSVMLPLEIESPGLIF